MSPRPRKRWTAALLADVVQRHDNGESYEELAKEYNCTASTISRVIYEVKVAPVVLKPPVVHEASTGYFYDAAGNRFTRHELLNYLSAERQRERLKRWEKIEREHARQLTVAAESRKKRAERRGLVRAA
jgi:hypothetical protein